MAGEEECTAASNNDHASETWAEITARLREEQNEGSSTAAGIDLRIWSVERVPGPDSPWAKEPIHAMSDSDDSGEILFVRAGIFPLFKLPQELRNTIYAFAMTNNRDWNDRIILVNDLNRRKVRRANIAEIPMVTGLSKKSMALARAHGFCGKSKAKCARLGKRVADVETLLAVNLLLVSRDVHREATAVMYEANTFAVIVKHHYSATSVEPGFGSIFPTGIDLARVRVLRIEYQLPSIQALRPNTYRNGTWSTFSEMHSLKHVHILVTFTGDAQREAEVFDKCWRMTTAGSSAMKGLIAAIPKWVNKVTWGLSKVEKETGDYGGVAHAKNCVLRKIWKTYAPMQGIETDLVVARPNLVLVQPLPVDGDGDDSDEDEGRKAPDGES